MKYFLRAFGVLAIILTLFPFIPIEHWTIRIFDFPHVQLTILTLVALLTYFLRFDLRNVKDYLFVGALSLCFLFQAAKIFPYTSFSKYEVQNASLGPNEEFSMYTANVLQKNDDKKSILEDTKRFNADVVLYTETNEAWIRNLRQELDATYSYIIEVPKDNTYGMVLFSKFNLADSRVRYLVEDTIPSIHTKVVLPSGKKVQLFAIHPPPPTPHHNPSSVDRDAELMKVAKISRKTSIPVVVMGDFNDVAWSQTTSLFQNFSGLLDLRKGRGFFNTYNAQSWLMRWPLDHIFTSPEFRVVKVALGSKVGSDHFPFYASVSLEPELADEQRLPPPSKEEIKAALDQIEDEQGE